MAIYPHMSCDICLSELAYQEFKCFPCGHSYCKKCVDTLLSRAEQQQPPTTRRREPIISCPTCRRQVRRNDVCPLEYLKFIDAKVAFTNRVVEGFQKMDEKSPLESVRKAAEKVEKGVKLAKGDNGLLAQLLEALEDFKTRMIPFFETTQACAEEVEMAMKEREAERKQRLEAEMRQLADLQALRRELRLAQQRSSHLQNEAANATMLLDEATLVGEQLKDQMVDVRKDRDNLKRLYTESVQDNHRLSGLLESNVKYTQRTRDEFKKYDKELKRLRAVEIAHEELKEKHRQALADLKTLPASQQPQGDDENVSIHEPPSSARTHIHERKSMEFDFEGLPKPGFGTDWQLKGNRSYGSLGSVRPPGAAQSQRRVANPANFPLKLDRKGKPLSAVQLGPKRTVRI